MKTTPILTAHNLHKTYRKDAVMVPVLRGVDIEVQRGEFLCVLGQSGSGKSTMLHLLGTLDRPDEGSVVLEGRRIDDLPGAERDKLRNQTFGFIFQFYHLLPELSTLENVLMPHMIELSLFGWLGARRELKRRALEMLDRVGLGHRLKHLPRELSGGEMQRAAIARALITRPPVLLADEPTGNLDAQNGGEIMRILRDLNREVGLTIIMVTHNLELIHETDRVVRLVDGQIEQPSFGGKPALTEPWVLSGTA
ncbi:MAG: ABC transporter ATP-binding protein [Gemmataceae bacterium]